MKFKKIISAISAFAMAASLFTVASAASLGGKPTVTATFDGYEKVSDTVAFAYVNVTIDMTAAETLEAYSNELDEIIWEEIVKGNGISIVGTQYSYPTTFTYTSAKSTKPEGWSVEKNAASYNSGMVKEKFWVEPVTTIKLALRVNNFDATGDFVFTAGGTAVDGVNSAENNAVWSYAQAENTITVTGCSIPSYNEWSKPADPEPTVVPAKAVTSATTGDDEVLDTTSKAAQAYVAEAAIASGDKVTWVAANRTSEIDATIANIDATTKLGLIITGDASTLGAISLKVAAN